MVRTDRRTGKKRTVLQAPVWTGHADFIHPFDFIRFANETTSSQFDIMLEAKAKDLALLRLRRDIASYAPALAVRFEAAASADLPAEIELAKEELE